MAENAAPLKEMGGLIPSVYYDLIARISPGVPFIVILLWDSGQELSNFKELIGSTGLFLLLVAMGYLAGLFLQSLSMWVGAIPRCFIKRRLGLQNLSPHQIAHRSDQIGIKNKEAGATLTKMSAEATLCENLLLGILLLSIPSWLGLFHLTVFTKLQTGML